MSYPNMTILRQQLDNTEVNDVPSAVKEEMKLIHLPALITPGSKVAITAGSRGITDIVPVLGAVVREVKEAGAQPFLVPAMGSHGGATAEGQLEILEDYGITEQSMGAPIVSSMQVVTIGKTRDGIPVMIDRHAAEADHIIVVNRIKPHTEFQGCVESGLMKMMVIGLGKHQGTLIAHDHAVKYGYEHTIVTMGQCILDNAPITCGVGIIENGYGKTARITAIISEGFVDAERALLREANTKTPKLPFDKLDILIVDECGKEISGTGIDTKVVGRIMNIYELEVKKPVITRIILRDLTPKTHGNALGMGLADFITRRAADKIDFRSTYVNCVTAVTPEKGRLPIVCETDREALDFAIATAGPVDSENLRLVWIKNTSCLGEMFVSNALAAEGKKMPGVTLHGDSFPLVFDEEGTLKRP